jgi:hypothetical protein
VVVEEGHKKSLHIDIWRLHPKIMKYTNFEKRLMLK